MDKDQIIATLVKHYHPLSAACQEELAAHSKVLVLGKGTQILREGEYANTVYYVAKGVARAFYLKNGKDISDWFAFENDFICAIDSYFLEISSPYYIETLDASVLLGVHKEQVNQLSDKYRDFDRLGKVIVTKTMLQLQQRIVSMQFETAKQNYENLLTIRPEITQRIPLTHIASYLGITLETLSRIRSPKYRI
ncbi:MAG: Crp/Fnr family transcriptional regulator [Bacteroidota bacterium]